MKNILTVAIIVFCMQSFPLLSDTGVEITKNSGTDVASEEETKVEEAEKTETGENEKEAETSRNDDLVSFKGVIIFISDTTIELKSGKAEISMDFQADADILYKEKAVTRESLQVCQVVMAHFRKGDDRNELVKLEIIKKSYCAR